MQHDSGTMRITRHSDEEQVGYAHFFKLPDGKYYDWFVAIDGHSMSTPLDLSVVTYAKLRNADQKWWGNDPNHTQWSQSTWETKFAAFLDAKNYNGGWVKKNLYIATETTW